MPAISATNENPSGLAGFFNGSINILGEILAQSLHVGSSGNWLTSFTVKELMGGYSSATFDWEVAAKRKGCEDERLEPLTLKAKSAEE